MNNKNNYFEKPELDGDAFFWPGGPEGVLLVHGLAATTAEVRLLAKFFHNAGYTVAAPLLPGHNTHPSELNRVNYRQWIESADEMYTRMATHCERIAIGGESTGGVICIEIARRRQEVAALLLYAPALILKMSKLKLLIMRLLAPFVPWVKSSPSGRDMPWKGYTVRPLKGVLQLLALQKLALAHLGDVHQPTLIMQGRLDRSVDPSVPDLIALHIGSQIKEIYWMENSTHCLILDQEFEQVAEISLQFLNRIWSGLPAAGEIGSRTDLD